MKDNRQRLFEMMNRVGGMPLIKENSGMNNLPPGFSKDNFMSLEDFMKQSHVNEELGDDPPETTLDLKKSDKDYHGANVYDVKLKDVIDTREMGKYKGNSAYIHNKTIEKIRIEDETGKEISEDDFGRLVSVEPKSLIGPNSKMGKTNLLKTSLPAYMGLFYDEYAPEGNRIKIVLTCPNAGDCKLYCFQQKGSAVQYENASLDKMRALHFLLNHWDKYKAKIIGEINARYQKGLTNGYRTIIRWHDSGDFISEDYLKLIIEIATLTPNVLHYAYTKMVHIVKANELPPNFIFRFSIDAGAPENDLIDKLKDKHAEVVPKAIFKDYTYTQKEPVLNSKGMQMYEKGKPKMKTVYYFKSDTALAQLKSVMASFYSIDANSILAFSEMPEEETGVNKWNVIVTPSDADTAAHRQDVLGVYLLIH